MNVNYKILRPQLPVPYMLDMVMEWPIYRQLTKEQIMSRVVMPIGAGCVRFLQFEGEDRCAYTFNRLPKKPMEAMLQHGPGPATWLRYPGGIMWVIDCVTTPGVKAQRYAPTIIQSMLEMNLVQEGEPVVWYRAVSNRVAKTIVRNRRMADLALEA